MVQKVTKVWMRLLVYHVETEKKVYPASLALLVYPVKKVMSDSQDYRGQRVIQASQVYQDH
jgi:hypothetical protein